jgi:hypothetical protein
MFHEVAHGLGINYTIDGSSTVSEALLDVASSMEEGKADVLGLYMVTSLHDAGELGEVDLRDYYVTFMTSVFRSIRFGAHMAKQTWCASISLLSMAHSSGMPKAGDTASTSSA